MARRCASTGCDRLATPRRMYCPIHDPWNDVGKPPHALFEFVGLTPSRPKYIPTRALAKIVGSQERSRLSTQKAFWAYIKKHNLVKGKSSTQLNLDEALRDFLGSGKRADIYTVTRAVGRSLKRAGSVKKQTGLKSPKRSPGKGKP